MGEYRTRDKQIDADDLGDDIIDYLKKYDELSKEYDQWMNYHDSHFIKAKKIYKEFGLFYTFRLFKSKISNNRSLEVNKEVLDEVLGRIINMYPYEKIKAF